MGRRERRPRRGLSASSLSLAMAAAVLGLAITMPATAQLRPEAELAAEKAYWQKRYRSLLERADELRATITREQELYADANRRNYRRGPVRHVHRDAMMEAEEELARVEKELSGIQDEARRAGALPGWLYEVEVERADPGAIGEK